MLGLALWQGLKAKALLDKTIMKAWVQSSSVRLTFLLSHSPTNFYTFSQVFETFMVDVKTQFSNRGAASDPLIGTLDRNIGKMKQTFDEITETLGTYDQKLVNVLGQHQDDFWFAFKTHMNKIEKEL